MGKGIPSFQHSIVLLEVKRGAHQVLEVKGGAYQMQVQQKREAMEIHISKKTQEKSAAGFVESRTRLPNGYSNHYLAVFFFPATLVSSSSVTQLSLLTLKELSSLISLFDFHLHGIKSNLISSGFSSLRSWVPIYRGERK